MHGGQHPTSAQGVTLCHYCTTRLETLLRDVRDVWANLMVTAARLDKGAASIGSSGHSAPAAPCNFDAIEDGDQLAAVLRGWAKQLAVVSPHFTPPRVAERLLNQVTQIRRRDWAGDLLHELRDALNAARRVTDRGAERVFAGMCTTETDGRVRGGPVHCPWSACGPLPEVPVRVGRHRVAGSGDQRRRHPPRHPG